MVQRDELASREEHWRVIQRTAEQVDTIVKLFENKSRSDAEDLEKFRNRANVLEGELSALQKVSNEQEKKIAVFNEASAASKATILNAQQRVSEWEKKAKERQQELEESRQQLKEIARAHDASAKNVDKLTAQLSQLEESERATSVCWQIFNTLALTDPLPCRNARHSLKNK
jgi:DNA repair exonuclease SbcCD ATPase subunit